MQMNEKVLTALEVLKDCAENDFERHRIDVLIKDLTDPPKFEIIDDNHQKFNGKNYHRDKYGHFRSSSSIHQAIFQYYCGEIPNNYVIHHIDHDPANNDISNLQLVTPSEHNKIHSLPLSENFQSTLRKKCQLCGKDFYTKNDNVVYCSHSCALKASHAKKAVQRKSETRICKCCGKFFPANHSVNGNFCSMRCNNVFNYHNKTEERICTICGRKFTVSKHSKTETCSRACGGILSVKRRLENQSTDDAPALFD